MGAGAGKNYQPAQKVCKGCKADKQNKEHFQGYSVLAEIDHRFYGWSGFSLICSA